jgi:tRNA-guanine family transglycosylase
MPVATKGSLKGLTPEQLEATGCRLCLNNTYHLGLKPGQAVLDKIGGAHRLQGWKHNLLTGTTTHGKAVSSTRTDGDVDSGGSVHSAILISHSKLERVNGAWLTLGV